MSLSEENRVLFPLLNVAEKSDSEKVRKWKKAYQAIKHDRAVSKEQANVGNLLNALGALYILNLYYKNESFWCNFPILDRVPYVNQSKIFAPSICDISRDITLLVLHSDEKKYSYLNQKMDESIYVEKLTSDAVREKRKIILNVFESCNEIDMPVSEWAKGISSIFDKPIRDLKFDPKFLKWFDNFNELNTADKTIIPSRVIMTKEIVLNKDLSIFPEESFEKFLETIKLSR